VHEDVIKALEATQEQMRRYADPHRKDNPAYQVGDLVILNRKNTSGKKIYVQMHVLRPDAPYTSKTSERTGRSLATYSPTGQC